MTSADTRLEMARLVNESRFYCRTPHGLCTGKGVMVWSAVSLDSRTSLVVVRGTLTAQSDLSEIPRHRIAIPVVASQVPAR